MKKSNYNDVYIPRDGVGAGRLVIDGKDTLLTLLNSSEPAGSHAAIRDQHGRLNDGSKASLLECVEISSTTHHWGNIVQHETRIFPHYVLLGHSFISSDEANIQAIRYHFENVGCLVNTLQTFGTIDPTREEFRQIIEADHKRTERKAQEHGWDPPKFTPEIGDHPILQYFSGRNEIVKCDVQIGSVAMNNRVSFGFGSPNGVQISNEITVTLEFATPATVSTAFASLGTLHSFFELCLGKRQRFLWIEVQLVKGGAEIDDPIVRPLQGYWSYCNERVSGETSPTQYVDALLDAGKQPAEFKKVLSGWLDSAATLGKARSRFTTAFHSGSYSVDRIIGAANMFDLLPITHIPSEVAPDELTSKAVEEARKRFKAFPDSIARQSVLSALGRVGQASLRDKICHRAHRVVNVDPNMFAELHLPCKQAVLCRNHFVHGSEGAFDYREEFNAFAFLTDTLEFVFAVSDLIELGWDYNSWYKCSPMHHNFGSYVVNYHMNLKMLKQLINA